MSFRWRARPVEGAAAALAAVGLIPLTSLTTRLRDELGKGGA